MKKRPSPLRSPSNMCASTSVKSRMRAPLESKSRTESFGPMPQAAASLSEGNAAPQAGSSSSLKPRSAASSEKTTGHVLSRAAFEISQAPTIAWTASAGAGACAGASMEDMPSAITAKTTPPRMDRLCCKVMTLIPPQSIGLQSSSHSGVSPALRWPPWRLRDRRERRLARRPRQKIVNHELIHSLARDHRSRAEMWKQHHMLHCDELRGHVRLARIDIQ